MTDTLFCWCRAGFEPELAAELSERAALAGHPGYARAERGNGYVEFTVEDAVALSRALPFDRLVFARQKLVRLADLRSLDPTDRITPILRALETLRGRGDIAEGQERFGDLWMEHPDSDTGKPL
ncbi:MAG TPA: hypothetical protein VFS82_10925, partial [Lysobacter sp.]|nr:hypothetical protein [Lysobacter sp.]